VASTKFVLRICISRLGRALIPLDSLSFVDCDARAIVVAHSKTYLRHSIPRLSLLFHYCEIIVHIIDRVADLHVYISGGDFALFLVLLPRALLAFLSAIEGSQTPRAAQNRRFIALGGAETETSCS
jgi:hypothetical protein